MELQIEDSILVRDYISGDEKALEILIHRHNQRISSFIYSKVLDRDITEDIFQDTFIKVIKTLKKGTYSEEGKFLPWVMRIAHNLIIDHFRKNKRMPMFEGNDDFNIFSVIGDDKLNAEKQLIKEQINVDMSFKEISENTGVSINTALGRMRYALINLRKIIDKNNIVLTNS